VLGFSLVENLGYVNEIWTFEEYRRSGSPGSRAPAELSVGLK